MVSRPALRRKLRLFAVVLALESTGHLYAATPGQEPATPSSPSFVPPAYVAIGTELSTEAEGRTVALGPGTTLRLRPFTKLRVTKPVLLPPGINDVQRKAHAITLLRGRVSVSVEAQAQGLPQGVMVTAPRKVSVLTRLGITAFSCNDDVVAISALEGHEPSAGIGPTWRTIAIGTAVVVDRVNTTGRVQALLPPPQAQLSHHLTVSLDLGAAAPHFEIQPQSETGSYWLFIDDAEGHRVTELETSKTTLVVPPLPSGSYQLKLATESRQGVLGLPSQPQKLVVLSLTLPAGAFVEGGKIYLAPEQRILLPKLENIELTYGKATVFIDAPRSIGLYNGHSISVRLRLKGTLAEVTLPLEPAAVVAKIELGPPQARWPRDAIHIRVTPVSGPRGPGVPLKLVEPVLTVNAQPVQVTWQQNGDSWIASLHNPNIYPGPWVVRVLARDNLGQVAGYDFIEVASLAGTTDEPKLTINRGTSTPEAQAQ